MHNPTEGVLLRSTKNTFFSAVSVLLVVLISIQIWASSSARREQELAAQRVEEATQQIPAVFKQLVHVQAGAASDPDLVWRGADSKLLLNQKVTTRAQFGGGTLYWEVLAVTKGGRFFAVSWHLMSSEICDKPVADCLYIRSLNEVTVDEAKTRLRGANKPDLYREVFKEEMRPAAIDA